jgi:hypothetical protein
MEGCIGWPIPQDQREGSSLRNKLLENSYPRYRKEDKLNCFDAAKVDKVDASSSLIITRERD